MLLFIDIPLAGLCVLAYNVSSGIIMHFYNYYNLYFYLVCFLLSCVLGFLFVYIIISIFCLYAYHLQHGLVLWKNNVLSLLLHEMSRYLKN